MSLYFYAVALTKSPLHYRLSPNSLVITRRTYNFNRELFTTAAGHGLLDASENTCERSSTQERFDVVFFLERPLFSSANIFLSASLDAKTQFKNMEGEIPKDKRKIL